MTYFILLLLFSSVFYVIPRVVIILSIRDTSHLFFISFFCLTKHKITDLCTRSLRNRCHRVLKPQNTDELSFSGSTCRLTSVFRVSIYVNPIHTNVSQQVVRSLSRSFETDVFCLRGSVLLGFDTGNIQTTSVNEKD